MPRYCHRAKNVGLSCKINLIVRVFWFFFAKKNQRFFLKKEAKTFYLLIVTRARYTGDDTFREAYWALVGSQPL